MNKKLRAALEKHKDDVLVSFLYYVKGDDAPHTFVLTPQEYYWKLTVKEVEGSFADSVELYWDARDFIKEHEKNEIVLLALTIKNFVLKTIDRTTYFYFDDKSLVYRLQTDFDQRFIDSIAIWTQDTDETYDAARIYTDGVMLNTDRSLNWNNDEKIAAYNKRLLLQGDNFVEADALGSPKRRQDRAESADASPSEDKRQR